MAGFRSSTRIFWRTMKTTLLLFTVFNLYLLWQKIQNNGVDKVSWLQQINEIKKLSGLISTMRSSCTDCASDPKKLIAEWQKLQAQLLEGKDKGLAFNPVTKQKHIENSFRDRQKVNLPPRPQDAYFKAHQPLGQAKEVPLEEGRTLQVQVNEETSGAVPFIADPLDKNIKKAQANMKARQERLIQLEQMTDSTP